MLETVMHGFVLTPAARSTPGEKARRNRPTAAAELVLMPCSCIERWSLVSLHQRAGPTTISRYLRHLASKFIYQPGGFLRLRVLQQARWFMMLYPDRGVGAEDRSITQSDRSFLAHPEGTRQ
jgi:hypothetical protein